MQVDQHVLHILTVTGSSRNSFDDATRHAIQGAWDNHHEEFVRFVSFEAIKFDGKIGDDLNLIYNVTVAISAIHREHDH